MALTWLHVSDFHLSPSVHYNTDVVLNSLVESVKWHRETLEWKPDLIFATGDIADKGQVAVFKEHGGAPAFATTFFDALLDAAGLHDMRERLFIVPGNHDVEQKKGIGLIRAIEGIDRKESQKNIDKYFTESPMYHFKKLDAFSAWYNSYFSALKISRVFQDKSTCELIPVTISGVNLCVLLMNSALFCSDDTDSGKLCIGRSCIDPFIQQLKTETQNHDLAMALVHHPIEFLQPCERKKIRDHLKLHVDLLLLGHDHETDVEPREELLQFTAGATYQENGSKKALYGRFDGTEIDVFPICYKDGSEKWTLDTDVFSDEPSHTKSYPVRSRSNPASSSPVSPETNAQPDNGYGRYEALLISKLDNAPPPLVQHLSAKVSKIFVSLRLSDTWKSEERHTPEAKVHDRQHDEKGFSPEHVMSEAFKENHLLLVIGDPGSGKTTLLKHYALSCLDNERCKDFGFTKPVMVFYLQLRELKKSDTGYAALPANICAWAEKRKLALPEAVCSEWLNQKKTLVLLDGLDEISELDERIKVCEWIAEAMADFSNACFVVTSRPTGYRRDDGIEIQVPLMRADILDFKIEEQEAFLKKWFTEVFLGKLSSGSKEWKECQIKGAHAKAAHIIDFLKRDENKSLRQLAGIPLLLQIMAMLWNKGDITLDSRASLYKNALDYFLGNQYKQKKRAPQLPVVDALGVLAPIALWMQEELEKDEADSEAMKAKMQDELNKLPTEQNPPEAKTFSDELINHAGLLVEFGDPDYGATDYAFCHKSFREYLTGFQLIKNGDESTSKLIKYFSEDWWEEPLRYYFGQIDAKTFNNFMQCFFNSPISEELPQKKQALLRTIIEETPKGKRKIDALCTRLLDPGTTASRQWVILDCMKTIRNSKALETLQQFRAKELAKNDTLDVTGRTAEVIRTLGGKVIGTTPSIVNPNEHNAEYILIPKGSYLESKTKEQKDVEKALYFAKYPVTNKRYRSFIAALANSKELRDKLNEIAQNNGWDSEFAKYLNDGNNDLVALFRSTYDEDRKFGGDDQPVVGITWYAAKAYALWLSQLKGKLDSYRLPNEVEWEWAAGGRQGEAVQEVREYPWADNKGQPNPKLLNYNGNVGATTPVGSYPEGATPEGLYDMAGNVWEWTDSWYDESASLRVLRGGSWYYTAEFCRSAYRYSFTPGLRLSTIGFRLVFVP